MKKLLGVLALVLATLIGQAHAQLNPGGAGGSPAGSVNDLQTNAGGGNFGYLTPGTGVATALANPIGTASGDLVTGGAITAGGPVGSATVTPIITYNAAGQITAVSSATIAPPFSAVTGSPSAGQIETNLDAAFAANYPPVNGDCLVGNATPAWTVGACAGTATAITVGTTTVGGGSAGHVLYDNSGTLGELALGTGVATALGVNVGTAGAPVVNGGALGTPSSGTATNLSGTAASLTAGNVTTNANLTGPVTSSGNATAFASMTANAFLTGNGTALPNQVALNGLVKGNGGSAPTVSKWTLTDPTTAATLTAGADNVVYTGPAKTATLMASDYSNAAITQNSPADGGGHSYTILAADLTKQVLLVSTFTAAVVPQATGSFAAPAQFTLYNAGAITATSTTSTINGIAGATGIKLGANTFSEWTASGGNWTVAISVSQPTTQTGTTVLRDDMTWVTLGTAGAASTGTSGHTLGFLDGANTYSGAQTFGETHGTTYAPTYTSNNYNAVAGDCGEILLLPTGTTPTVTLPNLNSDCRITVMQNSATQVTIQAASGGTLVSVNSYTKTKAQNAILFLFISVPSASAATWVLSGDGA